MLESLCMCKRNVDSMILIYFVLFLAIIRIKQLIIKVAARVVPPKELSILSGIHQVTPVIDEDCHSL